MREDGQVALVSQLDAHRNTILISRQYASKLLEGTRISDGKQVMIKKIVTADHPSEPHFGRFFSKEPNASHPSNHCVPIYNVLKIPNEQEYTLLVMPFLVDCNTVPFETVGEAVEFSRQIFEVSSFCVH